MFPFIAFCTNKDLILVFLLQKAPGHKTSTDGVKRVLYLSAAQLLKEESVSRYHRARQAISMSKGDMGEEVQ